MKYTDLNLDPRLFSTIEKLNYVEATPIQEQAAPHILLGKDVSGLAQTGTGKTAAFLIPLMERILKTKEDPQHERSFKDWNARSFVLILVPTRELADQINENAEKLGLECGLRSFPLYGGTGYEKQKEALQYGLQFVISTPGRLIDLYKENCVDLKQVRAIVFDEADRMFDMGFKEDMKFILSRVPKDRQFLVFSATLNFDVLNTAYQYGAEPIEINISRDQAKADHVKDFILHLGDQEKPQFLISLLKKENPTQAMIFTNFKYSVDKIAGFLMANNIPAMGISSLMSQSQRIQVIEKFKAENNQNILVATDVAARGLDINGVDLVVNYEMPQDAESYVHRIGRTGRAGRDGKAFSFISDKDIDSLARVEEYTKKKINVEFLEDAELIKDFVAYSHDESKFQDRFDRNSKYRDKGRSDRKESRFEKGRPQFQDKNKTRATVGKDLNQRPDKAQLESKADQRELKSEMRSDFKNKNGKINKNNMQNQFNKDGSSEKFSKRPHNLKGKNNSIQADPVLKTASPKSVSTSNTTKSSAVGSQLSFDKNKVKTTSYTHNQNHKSFRNNSSSQKGKEIGMGEKLKLFFRKIFS